MKHRILFLLACFVPIMADAVARFPKPDFTSGYQYPEIVHGLPLETLWSWVDVVLLVVMMGVVANAGCKRSEMNTSRRSRGAVVVVSVVSVLYFGFFRSGCVCSVGSLQNVVLALTDSSYHLPWVVLLMFLLPLVAALFFGRVFCGGVCPFGALQDLVNVRNLRISRAVSGALGVIPWIYLSFAILYAATRSQFIICRFDPFISIFRLGGDMGMIVFGVLLLLLSVFVGRPFCQFLCPYGALLGLFSRVARWKVKVTPHSCINCTLCHDVCPVDAIRPPDTNRPSERRQRGMKRVLLHVVLLPLFTLSGALLLASQSKTLSIAHKDVRLFMLLQQAGDTPSAEVEAFHEMGRKEDELKAKVADIQHQYEVWSLVAGGLIGFVVGIKLLKLTLKRTRKTYEVDASACVVCTKCFDYCPQNKKKRITNIENRNYE